MLWLDVSARWSSAGRKPYSQSRFLQIVVRFRPRGRPIVKSLPFTDGVHDTPMHAVLPLLQTTDFPAIRRGPLDTVQVNLGYRCNQSCLHCHVNAGPKRTEMMELGNDGAGAGASAARRSSTLDLTGGAPEMNPHFRYLVESGPSAGAAGHRSLQSDHSGRAGL